MYAPVTRPHYVEFAIKEFRAYGTPIPGVHSVIGDSGTTLWGASKNTLRAIRSARGSSGLEISAMEQQEKQAQKEYLLQTFLFLNIKKEIFIWFVFFVYNCFYTKNVCCKNDCGQVWTCV